MEISLVFRGRHQREPLPRTVIKKGNSRIQSRPYRERTPAENGVTPKMLHFFLRVAVHDNYIRTWWKNAPPRVEAVDGYLRQGYFFLSCTMRPTNLVDASPSTIPRKSTLDEAAVWPVYDFDEVKRATVTRSV